MRRRSISTLVAAGLLVATLVGGNATTASARAAVSQARVTPNTFVGRSTGYGPTLQAAKDAARDLMDSTYGGCGPAALTSSSQLADGTWKATIAATCSSYI